MKIIFDYEKEKERFYKDQVENVKRRYESLKLIDFKNFDFLTFLGLFVVITVIALAIVGVDTSISFMKGFDENLMIPLSINRVITFFGMCLFFTLFLLIFTEISDYFTDKHYCENLIKEQKNMSMDEYIEKHYTNSTKLKDMESLLYLKDTNISSIENVSLKGTQDLLIFDLYYSDFLLFLLVTWNNNKKELICFDEFEKKCHSAEEDILTYENGCVTLYSKNVPS